MNVNRFSVALHVNEDKGGHVRFVMFMGTSPGSRPRVGELVMTKDEFFVLLESLRAHQEVEDVTIVYLGAGNFLNELEHKDDSQTGH